VSRRDLLGVFRRSDEDIQREIHQEILVRTLWADPNSVSVTVDGGVVTMLGRLERKCEVEIARPARPQDPWRDRGPQPPGLRLERHASAAEDLSGHGRQGRMRSCGITTCMAGRL
jgi:hypothetical protein